MVIPANLLDVRSGGLASLFATRELPAEVGSREGDVGREPRTGELGRTKFLTPLEMADIVAFVPFPKGEPVDSDVCLLGEASTLAIEARFDILRLAGRGDMRVAVGDAGVGETLDMGLAAADKVGRDGERAGLGGEIRLVGEAWLFETLVPFGSDGSTFVAKCAENGRSRSAIL